jgi:hypothetical protein
MKKRIFRKAAVDIADIANLATQAVNPALGVAKRVIEPVVSTPTKVEEQKDLIIRFDEYARRFKSIDPSNPDYQDGETFAQFLKNKKPYLAKNLEELIKILDKIDEFLNAGSNLFGSKTGQKALDFVFHVLKKSGNANYAISELDKLKNKLNLDHGEFGPVYVKLRLENPENQQDLNLAVAFDFLTELLKGVDNKISITPDIMNSILEANNFANKTLGNMSADQAKAFALGQAQGRANFEKIRKDRNLYVALAPVRTNMEELRAGLTRFFGNTFDSPVFKTFITTNEVQTIIAGAYGLKILLDKVSGR